MTSPTLNEVLADNAELRQENTALHAAIAGDLPRAVAWLQRKVLRQRRALDQLQRKGPGHTHTERAEAAAAKVAA